MNRSTAAPEGWWTDELRKILAATAGEPLTVTFDMKRAANIALKVARGERWNDEKDGWEQASAVSPPALLTDAQIINLTQDVGECGATRVHELHGETLTIFKDSELFEFARKCALIDQHGGALEQQQCHQSALAALAELVACDDLLKWYILSGKKPADYQERCNAAVANARRVLAEGHQSERSETAEENGNG